MTTSEHTGDRLAAHLTVGTVDWYEGVARLVRKTMLANGYDRRSCVAATWITGQVLAYFGVAWHPLPVRCLVFSRDAADWHAEHGWGAVAPVGHSIGVGYRPTDESGRATGVLDWPGHLVVRLGTVDAPSSVMIDTSIDQASRPAKGINLADPMVLSLLDGWGADEGELAVFRDPDNTVVLAYQPLIGDGATDYLSAPDWGNGRNVGVRRRIAGRAIRVIREVTAP